MSSAESGSRPAPPPSAATLVCVFLVSFCVLAFEISLTRLFSVLLRYHYVFLVVSITICGLGVGGLIRYQLANRLGARAAGWYLAAFAITLPMGVALLLRSPWSRHLGSNLWLGTLPFICFAAAGMFMADVFERSGAYGGRLYAADLLGASTGLAAVIPLLAGLGAIRLPIALGGTAAAAAIIWAATGRQRALLAAGLVVIAGCAGTIWLDRGGGWLTLPLQTTFVEQVTKPLFHDLADPALGGRIELTEWSALARTDVVAYSPLTSRGRFKYVYTDGETPAHMIPFHGDFEEIAYLKGLLPYFPFLFGKHHTMLSIGPGGGMDVLLALMAGTRQITGVEINASTLRAMDRFRSFNGGIYHDPQVRIVWGDGRSFIAASRSRYDLVYSALTQTATAGSVGLSLVEDYVYTLQAFRDYYRHLTPDGQVAILLQDRGLLRRGFMTAAQAMREMGLTAPQACQHLAAFSAPEGEDTPYRHLLLWSRVPFTLRESQAMAAQAQAMNLVVTFAPGVAGDPMLMGLATGGESFREAAQRYTYLGAHLDLRPATDDKPFFLDMSFGVPPLIRWLGLGSAAVVIVFSVIVLAAKRREAPGARRLLGGYLLYFAALGIGFMLIEIPLAQKLILLLAHPTISLTVTLFALLAGGALGSLLSQGVPLPRAHIAVAMAAAATAALACAYGFGLAPLVAAGLRLPMAARVLVAIAAAFPLGVAMGVPFPTGIRLLSAQRRGDVPWMWGVNGVMSVAGSVGAVAGAKLVGFHGVLLLGAATYAAVAILTRWTRLRSP